MLDIVDVLKKNAFSIMPSDFRSKRAFFTYKLKKIGQKRVKCQNECDGQNYVFVRGRL